MRVVAADTVGPLPDGHRALIGLALHAGDEGVIDGLMTDDLATETRDEHRTVPPSQDRRAVITSAFDRHDEWDPCRVIGPLMDLHGIARRAFIMDALVGSSEPAAVGDPINDCRRPRDLDPLEALVVPLLLAEDGERM